MSMQAIVNRVNNRMDTVIRKSTIELFGKIVKMTPVGDPSTWESNKTAVTYNKAVSEENYRLRQDKANLTRAGRLKRGLKVKDSMKINAPDGYVGGRARGNWQCSIVSPISEEIDRIDRNGSSVMKEIRSAVKSGNVVWLANNVPYIRALEYGHSKQAPEGMVRIAVAEFGSIFSTNSSKSLSKIK